MSTESNKELLNAIESREKQPTYINLSEVHRNDDLIALYKNSLRQVWNPSVKSEQATGHISWNNIRPPSLKIGIKDVFIENETVITFTIASDTGTNVNKVRDGMINLINDGTFKNDCNAALYNTQIAITGQTSKGHPYIDLAIKRFYDPAFYDAAAFARKCDKNVFCYAERSGNNEVKVYYHCSSPFLHPMFSSENDIAGISALSIETDYNIWALFSFFDTLKTVGETSSNTTVITTAFTSTTWKIVYNQTNYSKDLNNYATLCTNEQYYTLKNLGDGNLDSDLPADFFQAYIGEVPGAPICQYTLAINSIENIGKPENVTIYYTGENANISNYYKNYYSPIKANLSSIELNLNGNLNIYNTSALSDIYHCCKNAGYLGSFNDFTSPCWPSVFGFSSLQYNNKINTTDTYSLGCNNFRYVDNKRHTLAQARVYWVYLYPALFFAGDDGDGYTNTLGAPLSAMIKSESDIDEYLREIEAAGYSGGSLWSWLKNLKEKLKKGRYISNTAKTISNVLGNEGVKSLVSMIPTVGPAISSGINTAKNVADKVGSTAESIGYGVNMF